MTEGQSAAALSTDLAELADRLRLGVVQVQMDGRGIGSAVVWQASAADATSMAEATIITNAHVVHAAHASELTLRTAGGRELTGVVSAVDPARDLAALRVQAQGLHPLEIGDSAALRVGELVVAVGSPFGRFGAMTVGVVAAQAPADPDLAVEPAEDHAVGDAPQGQHAGHGAGRHAPLGRRWLPRLEVIQADIRLYPGNSGGPLADARGRVVGINAMVGGGLAFAIPSRTVQQFLIEAQRLAHRTRLGVEALSVPLPPMLAQRLGTTQTSAALIAAVADGGTAAVAGMLVGDIVLAVAGQPILGAPDLARALMRRDDHRPFAITLARGGQRHELMLAPLAAAA